MPVLSVLAVAGSALVALLFLADATLDKNGPPAIVTSQRTGLPELPRHSDGMHISTSAPAPAPDMTSQAVLNAQPEPSREARTMIEPIARAARAEAPPKTMGVASLPPVDYQQNHFQQTGLVDRFSIKGQ
jgi:hypothetical protein